MTTPAAPDGFSIASHYTDAEALELCAIEIRRLESELAARDATISAALKLAELRWDINVAGNHDPAHLLKRIEAVLRGDKS